MKYIIMCGGDYPNWKKPKQLISIKAEPIVVRTIRLLREAGITDIAISSNHPAFEGLGVPVLKHENEYTSRHYNDYDGCWCDAFYPTDEPTCYLLGDVYFSPEAIRTIVEYETDDIMFFGSKRPFAQEYPKDHVEPFAFKVANNRHLRAAIKTVKIFDKQGLFARKPIAWELWYVIAGSDPYQDAEDIKGPARDYVAINDYTCDIDEPWEARLLRK